MWIGFFTVAFIDEPSPNDQDHEVGVLVEASVKVTVSGAESDIWMLWMLVKAATGFTVVAATVIYFVKVLLPAGFLTVSVTL